MGLEKIFLKQEEKFLLNILMDQAEKDLKKILKENDGHVMDLETFFPMFRDSIYGLTFLHNKFLVHRDIKPENIMMMCDNNYVLADYGEGENM